MMESCKDCIHYDMCKYRPLAIGVDICDVFRNTADVVPKSEVERLEHLRAELSKEVADLQDALKCEKETNKHLNEEYISAQKEIARLEKASLPSYCQAVSEEEAIKIGKEYGRAGVAREIFEEIEKTFIDSAALPDCARFVDIDKIAELKKKYPENIE